jgi:hypothetical protein
VLSFDINDEIFLDIMLLENYLDGFILIFERVVMSRDCCLWLFLIA